MSNLSYQNDRDADIALWGPTSAGKSWMIRALSRELHWYNQRDPEFHYRVTGQGGQVYSWQPPTSVSVPATPDPVDRVIQFHREAKKQTNQHRISSFLHTINLHDNAGLNLVQAMHSPGMDDIVETTLESSPHVIAVLDPTTIPRQSIPGGSSSPTGSPPGTLASVAAYQDSVNALCHFLTRTRAEKKFLAVCINKVDALGLKSPPNQLLRMLFHQAMDDILESYHAVITIKVFATSSVGYYTERGVQKSNITSVGEIERPNLWRPCVAAPFFWIFEQKERERLGKRKGFLGPSLDEYISYPPIRRC